MQELIQSLQEKIGLTGDQAKDAASHFVDFIKAKLPSSLHDHIDSAVSGGSSFMESAKEKVESLASGIAGKFNI